VEEWDHLFAEAFLILGAIDVGVNLGVVTLFLQDGEVMEHLSFVLRCPAQ
jgi:hypothetical protein